MAERINKLILETEIRTTGDVTQSVSKIETLEKAVKDASGETLKLVEAENKLKNASLELGKSIETQTSKQTAMQKAIQGTEKAMNGIASNQKLKQAFTGSATQIEDVNKKLRDFEKTARAATSVEELTKSVNEFVDSLPDDVRADAIKTLDKEFERFNKTVERPTARLRELKRLIATTDDPKLLKAYNEEAGKLTDELGDNNDLIRALASDTFYTDTLVQGAQTAVSAFTAFQGAITLVTDDQEEFAKAAAKAQGALALLQGTQTLLNELKKSDNIITRTQIVAQKIYTAAVGETIGAQKALRIALLATGIGAIVVAVGLLAANWDKVKDAVSNTTRRQRLYNDIQKESIKGYVEEKVELEQLAKRYKDSGDSLEGRTEVIEKLQEINPKYFASLDAEKTSYDELKKSVDSYVTSIRDRAKQT